MEACTSPETTAEAIRQEDGSNGVLKDLSSMRKVDLESLCLILEWLLSFCSFSRKGCQYNEKDKYINT